MSKWVIPTVPLVCYHRLMCFIIYIYIIVSGCSQLFVRITLSKANKINIGVQNIVNC